MKKIVTILLSGALALATAQAAFAYEKSNLELPEGISTKYFSTVPNHIDNVYFHDFDGVTDKTYTNVEAGKTIEKENQISISANPSGEGKVLKLRNRKWAKDSAGNYQKGRAWFASHGANMHSGVSTDEEGKSATSSYFKGVPLMTGINHKQRLNQIFSVDVYIESGALRIGYVTHAAEGTSTTTKLNTILNFHNDGHIYQTGGTKVPSAYSFNYNTWYTVTICAYVGKAGGGYYSSHVTGDFGNGIETVTISGKRTVSAWDGINNNLTFSMEVQQNDEDWVSYIDNYSHNILVEDVQDYKFLKDNEEISALVPGKIDFEISCDEHVGYTPTVILALRKGDELKLVETDNTTVTDENKNKYYTASVNVPEDIDSTYTLEAFVWDSISGMKPIQSVQALEVAEATE